MFSQRRETYCYQSLPEPQGYIRLLRLESGITKPVTAHLVTVKLGQSQHQQAPPYHALSYAWGTGRKNVAISIDATQFMVTSSLANALEQIAIHDADDSWEPAGFRSFDSTRYIWCDQICINQDDVDERGQQVQQMNRIYSSSQRTIVWLGVDTGFAAAAIQLLRRIEQQYDDQVATVNGSRQMMQYLGRGVVDWDRHEEMQLPSTWAAQWRAMEKFLGLSWFQRLWIIQEVVLSRQDPVLMIGSIQCSWTMVAWASHWLYIQGYHDGYVPRAVRGIQMILHMREHDLQYDIGALIWMATFHFASDPRDNVYGILGLEALSVGDVVGPSSILPDYSLSVPMAYWTSTRNVITSSKSLAILSLPTIRAPGSWDMYGLFGRQASWTGFPSWVAHLEDVPHPRCFASCYRSNTFDHFWSLKYHNSNNLAASGNIPVEIVDRRPVSSVLAAKGLRFDKVRVCLQTSPWEGLARQNRIVGEAHILTGFTRAYHYLRECRHWGILPTIFYLLHILWAGLQRSYAQDMWKTAVKYGRYEDPLEMARAVLDATTAGMDAAYKTWEPVGLAHFAAFMAAMDSWWPSRYATDHERHAKEKLLGFARANTGDAQAYAVSMRYWCALRRFFVTEQGYIGIGPSAMRTGDVVCVLFGGGVPFVLRPREDHWLLIGDCYVHELGQGQAIYAWARGELHEEVFRIH